MVTYIAINCLFVFLNGKSIGCRVEDIKYRGYEREIRIGDIRIGGNPGLKYFPVEQRVEITGTEIPVFKDGFQ